MSPPDLADEYFKKAYECQMGGQLEQAVEYYKKSIEVRPTAEAHTFLGWTYSFMRRYEEAIRECHRAIAVDPDFGNPYNDIGVYLMELARLDEAVPWFEKAIQAPRYEPRHYPHFNLARVYVRNFEYDKAIGHLRKALELTPGYKAAEQELRRLMARMN
jgi:tetratricopeptide (TPR) repeat protein